MANAEVSVPVGDVVVVPTAGNEGENPEDTKTQVILQLQPVSQGIYGEGTEPGTAVVAVETHTIHKIEGEIDASSIETHEELEIAYPITCGESKAILLWKKFVCPGINVKCVKFNDQLISPKHFVHLAGKSTLKDWKRAIRLGGIMLRKMMDSGQIDFYQHDKVCTNTCRSTKFDLLISSARAPVPGQQASVGPGPPTADGRGLGASRNRWHSSWKPLALPRPLPCRARSPPDSPSHSGCPSAQLHPPPPALPACSSLLDLPFYCFPPFSHLPPVFPRPASPWTILQHRGEARRDIPSVQVSPPCGSCQMSWESPVSSGPLQGADRAKQIGGTQEADRWSWGTDGAASRAGAGRAPWAWSDRRCRPGSGCPRPGPHRFQPNTRDLAWESKGQSPV